MFKVCFHFYIKWYVCQTLWYRDLEHAIPCGNIEKKKKKIFFPLIMQYLEGVPEFKFTSIQNHVIP